MCRNWLRVIYNMRSYSLFVARWMRQECLCRDFFSSFNIHYLMWCRWTIPSRNKWDAKDRLNILETAIAESQFTRCIRPFGRTQSRRINAYRERIRHQSGILFVRCKSLVFECRQPMTKNDTWAYFYCIQIWHKPHLTWQTCVCSLYISFQAEK